MERGFTELLQTGKESQGNGDGLDGMAERGRRDKLELWCYTMR